MAEYLEKIGKCIITQCLWPPIKTHVDYWWCFDNNVQVLRNGVRDLGRETLDINQKIEEARLRTDKLRPEVEKWSKAATEKLEEATRILEDDINPKAWNLISRYSIGKRAKKAEEEIVKHLEDRIDVVADPAPPPAMGSTPHRSTMGFESRKRIEEDIIKSLKKSSVGMIGICGMGGVGKTTMAQRIRERVMEEKLFDEAVMVVVSQQIDMLKIQKEVAELLGLKFDVESMPARTDKFRNRLMDPKRKLIIFDDVWERLNLDDLGVPFVRSGFEKCKILLTTRYKGVCQQMEAQEIIPIEILTEDEAWNLFKEKAGDCVEGSDLQSLAKKVVAECKGLPIALVTVGKALRDKKKSIWVDSLSQLSKANPVDFQELWSDVYNPLKLSYDYLDNEREKLLFLLCCLFPEDYDIPVEELTLYFMGLRKFDGSPRIEEARNRTDTLVEKLKSRFLLIDGKDDFHVKMHDVVRDVAIYIGSKEKDCLVKSQNKISTENSADINCNWMSVEVSNEPMKVDMGLHFPKLRLLMLLNHLNSDISLEGIRDLNVLKFSYISIGSLPPTLALLQNLRTLYLYRCNVKDISVIGELAALEILYCHSCDKIKKLPAEIGKLNHLRLLELNLCRELHRIPFGILSSLVRLEELKIFESFYGWEADENGKEMRKASVRELESLPNLTCLEIQITDSNLAAQHICISPKLVKYYIDIGFKEHWYKSRDYEKAMNLKLPSDIGAVGKWIQILVKSTERLRLEGDGANNFNLKECQALRNLIVSKCSTLKKLVKTKDCKSGIVFPMLERLQLNELENIEEIWDGIIIQNQNVSSLCNLKYLYIESCSKLRHLFSVSVATTCLLQLQVLRIEYCDAMEQVFRNDVTDGCNEFPKLKELTLINCSTLKKLVKTKDCKSGIVFPSLETLELRYLRNIEEIWDGTIILNQNVSSLCNLKSVRIYGCSKLRYLFSVSVATTCLLQLEFLLIEECEAMEQVFRNDITDGCIEFPKLKELTLRNLPNLTAFCQGLQTIKFPNLTEMWIGGLPNLNSFCPLNSETDNHDKNSFHLLCNPKPKLRMFWQWNLALELPLLEEVIIRNCPVMETFTLGSLNTPNLKRLKINDRTMDDMKNLNDIPHHHFITENMNTSMIEEEEENEDANKDEDEDANKIEYNDENINKDEDEDEDVDANKDENNIKYKNENVNK